MAEEEMDFDVEKATTDMLLAAAKAAHGYVYYESESEYDGDSRPIRINIYERYQEPDPKFAAILPKYAAILKKEGVEVVMHTRS